MPPPPHHHGGHNGGVQFVDWGYREPEYTFVIEQEDPPKWALVLAGVLLGLLLRGN